MANPTNPVPIPRTASWIGGIVLLLIAVPAGVGYFGASVRNTVNEVDTIGILAVVAACLVSVVVAFQLALAAGTPWGAAAYGGRAALNDGTLPAKYRVASIIAGVVLLGVLWLILAAGGVIGRGSVPDGALTVGAWVLMGLFLLNTLGNLRGRHPLERWGFSAITAVLAVLCAAIAVYR
jgi:hypothetical protein